MNKTDKLYELVQNEHKKFLAGLKSKTPDQIIESAYEICYREDLAMTLLAIELDDKQLDFLLSLPNPIGFLYGEWLKTDISTHEMLRDAIYDIIKE